MSKVTDKIIAEIFKEISGENFKEMSDYELRKRGYHRINYKCESCRKRHCDYCQKGIEPSIVPLPHIDWRFYK